MQPLRVCVVGAGAIGGWLAHRLVTSSPADATSVLARGDTLAAIKRDGLRLLAADGSASTVAVRAADNASQLGTHDVVVLAVKSHALPALVPTLAPLMHQDTMVLPAINGVPWWFTEGLSQRLPALSTPLESVDRDGCISRHINAHRVVGCVVHASASSPQPGVIAHRAGNGWIVGEPSGAHTARVQALVARWNRADMHATASTNIRYDLWYKLWGNMTMNPASVLTHATMDRLLADPLVRDMCTRAMLEASVVGEHLGLRIEQTPEERHDVTAKLGAVRTSMLQDMEAGRALELDGIVGAVRELGARLGVATPTIDALHGLARVAAASRNA